MPYTPKTWENDEAGETPITAEALNHIEGGISDAEKTAAWATVSGKPAVIAAGADAGAARTAIGAGTSSLALGASGTTAAAGNHTHAASTVTVAGSSGIVGANVQAVLADLAARVVALEAG